MFGAVTAFLVGAGILYALKSPRHLKSYERSFVNKYSLTPTIEVPLSFEEIDEKYLLDLCKNYVKEKKLKADPPTKQTHWLGFRKVIGHLVKIELIRCTHQLAIIQSDEYHCAYLLRKAKKSKHFLWKANIPNQNFHGTIFHIRAKFKYGDELMLQKIFKEKESLLKNDDQHIVSGENLLENDQPTENHEQTIENDYRMTKPAAEEEFFIRNAGHQMNHHHHPAHYSQLRDDEVIQTQSGRQIYYPEMENLGMRSKYKPNSSGDDTYVWKKRTT